MKINLKLDSNKNYKTLSDFFIDVKNNLNRIRIQKQLKCKHTTISEGKTFGRLRPFRVCLNCGFAEWGWDCGYQILIDNKCFKLVNNPINFICGDIHENCRFVRDGDILNKNNLYKRAIMGFQTND